jgi:tetratricopeptide (TPR) repeat protein
VVPPAASPSPSKDAPAEDPRTVPPAPGAPGSAEFREATEVSASDPQKSEQLFSAAGKKAGSALAHFNAAVMAERQGQDARAAQHYQAALAVKPEHGPALLNWVLLAARTGQVPQAASAVNVAASRAATDPLVLTAAGYLMLAQGNTAGAEKNALAALKLDEKHVEAMRLLARCYFQAKRWELTLFVLKRAADIEPHNALVHEDMGNCYLQMVPKQQYRPAAKQAFERAVASRQDLPSAYNNLAVLYGEVGDVEAAAAAGRRVVELRPNLPLGWLNHGNALRAAKQYPEAVAAYQKARELDPSLTDATYNLGLLYLDNPVPEMDEADRLELAGKSLTEFLEKNPAFQGEGREQVEAYVRDADRTRKQLLKRRERDKRKAEEDAAKKVEEERKAKEEAEQKLKDEAEAKARAEAEAKAKAEEETRQAAEKVAAEKAALEAAAAEKAAAEKTAAEKAAADKAAADKAAAEKAAQEAAARAKPEEGGGGKGLKKPPSADAAPPADQPPEGGPGKGLKKAPSTDAAPPPADPPPAGGPGKGLKKPGGAEAEPPTGGAAEGPGPGQTGGAEADPPVEDKTLKDKGKKSKKLKKGK